MTKSWRDVLPIHPAAEPFPLMTPDELQALGEDIKKNGLKIPVTVWGGKGKPLQLLDGRNRLDAMEAVGIPIKRLKHFIEYYCEEPMVWEATQREQNAMAAPAVISERKVARPLKVLIPMIQSELQQGDSAGREHYRRAGQMLIEAKDQVGYGGWGRWLTKNFDLSERQAQRYMQWARKDSDFRHGVSEVSYNSLRHMTGETERRRDQYQSKQQQDFRRVLRDVAREEFVQERQARDDEVRLHRELAEEVVDIGYRALATRLHPDRGGSKDAMMRLNRVRDELKQIAQTRRFV